MSFSQGITGLTAAAANLDVIGNNIANAATVGFKSGSVAFKDVIAGSKIGLGVAMAGVEQNFAAGSVQLTSRPLDLAITNGDGFFRVSSSDGSDVAYTRNGQFSVDKDGYVVNTSGMCLTGRAVNGAGALQGGTPTPLRFPTQSMPPNATTAVAAQFNFDSRNPSLNPASFNATDSSTYTYSNAYNVFDSLGNPHEMALYFIKTANDAWSVQATADGAAMTGSANLAFDVNGAIQAPTNLALTFNYNNGSAPGAISVDLKGSTQFGNTSAVQRLKQDGYTSGNLNSYEVGANGIITGTYSNDQKNVLGQVILSSFPSPNGLEAIGNNAWAETGASGQPLTGDPGPGTTLGALTAGALEGSNVDLTTQLVDLITAQRTYQANAQTLKTQDQVTQTLVNMR